MYVLRLFCLVNPVMINETTNFINFNSLSTRTYAVIHICTVNFFNKSNSIFEWKLKCNLISKNFNT